MMGFFSLHKAPASSFLAFLLAFHVYPWTGLRASLSILSLFPRCGTCRATPSNWMCWQHNDAGRWQEAAEREAERRPVRPGAGENAPGF